MERCLAAPRRAPERAEGAPREEAVGRGERELEGLVRRQPRRAHDVSDERVGSESVVEGDGLPRLPGRRALSLRQAIDEEAVERRIPALGRAVVKAERGEGATDQEDNEGFSA